MIWFEVVEDLGDGSSATRRFKTEEEASRYVTKNAEYCYSGYDKVNTDSEWFWHTIEGEYE